MVLTKRQDDFSARYNELVAQADLAQTSAVRGCMVIKPYGYALREKMQSILDFLFKKTGHVNAYFPLFIPKSFFSKEAKHVEGFATEAAVVTHYRLKNVDGEIVVDPDAKLEEELIVRPTSETIIRNTYKDWITSYRDLPLLINQRANVVRWEMRTRLFLRSAEFLWQEGHTAHATSQEAIDEAKKMRRVYQQFFTHILALNGVYGEKSENERFAGAENTYTIECMMQDGKALQSCTSHFLGQNFGKAFDVTFMNKENKQEHAWATSRGASTRMVGGLIMSHSDDKGLVLPPMIAPYQIIFIPLWKTDEEKQKVQHAIDGLQKNLSQYTMNVVFTIEEQEIPYQLEIVSQVDRDDQKSMGRKQNEYELKGVPLRVVVGPRDIDQGTLQVAVRDQEAKITTSFDKFGSLIPMLLNDMQSRLLSNNQQSRENNTISVDSWEEFIGGLEQGKFVLAHWDGTPETEKKIKDLCKATIRCIPYDEDCNDLYPEQGMCILTGKLSPRRVLFAIAY